MEQSGGVGIQRSPAIGIVGNLPWLIAAALLVVAVILKIVVDVLFGNNDWPLWFFVWAEGGVIEQATWLMLGTGALLAMWVSGRSQGGQERFWGWFAVGLALLLVEDAGNISHRFADHADLVLPRLGIAPPSRNAARLVVFSVLGGVMLWVLFAYRPIWSKRRDLRNVLVGGYLLYSAASLLSVPFNLFFGGYERIGDRLVAVLYGQRLTPMPEPVWGLDEVATGLVWMDSVVEESLELMAAAFLATVSVRGWRSIKRSAEKELSPLDSASSPT